MSSNSGGQMIGAVGRGGVSGVGGGAVPTTAGRGGGEQDGVVFPGHQHGRGTGSVTPPFLSPRKKQHVSYSDRFIPTRAGTSRLDFSVLERETAATEAPSKAQEESTSVYGMLLKSQLLGCPPQPAASPDRTSASTSSTQHHQASPGPGSASRKLFKYATDASDVFGAPTRSPFSRGILEGEDGLSASSIVSPGRLPRRINRSPFKVLDAPSLADDFYLNLVDWSSMNTLAVGLGSCVYLWSACTSKVTRLVDLGDYSSVCSVAWSQRGQYLSIGTETGEVQIWDASKCRKIRSMSGHKQRVGCMSWSHHIMATGSRDRSILIRDVRAQEHWHGKLTGHRSEVCGLKWSPDDRELASGGNDNQLMIWQPSHGSTSDPLQKFSGHQAAVKAIAWSPHQHGLIASGGGTADRCIKFWNTSTGLALNSVDTGSQVCNLAWSKNVNEIVSTHGYSQNQIIVWRYQGMQKLATLTGHTLRVLYLACSPDGQTIVTGAGDETLRFWNVFPGPKAHSGGDVGVGSMMRTVIR